MLKVHRINLNNLPPITVAELIRLTVDTNDVKATAKRKGTTCDDWDAQRETEAAEQYFELGCWLYYYSRRVGLSDENGLASRIDCARRIFLAGLNNPGYKFFTIFDFGQRSFDTIFEMGDAEEVINALRALLVDDTTGQLKRAFEHMGWPEVNTPKVNKYLLKYGYETVDTNLEGQYVCKFCKSTEVVYQQSVNDASCQECGKFQND